MSKLQELIDRLCPEGVEFKTIKQTVGLNRGSRLTKSQLDENAPYEVYHGSKDTPLGNYHQFNAPKHTTIVVNTGGIGGVKFMENDFWCSDGSFWLGQVNYINPKFIYYYLSGFEEYFASKKRIGGVPTIDREVVESFPIPVPPIAVQDEIVKILDRFADYAAELQAELQARRLQYEYYRNLLLTFNPSAYGCGTDDAQKISVIARGGHSYKIQWKTMGEIGKFFGGLTGKSKADFSNGNARFISYMNVYSNIALDQSANEFVSILPDEKQNVLQYGDALFTGSSETPNECGMSSVVTTEPKEPLYLNSFSFGFRLDNISTYHPDFLKHLLRSTAIRDQIAKTANGVTRFNVSKALFAKIILPIPPIELQVKIASILDRFDTLVNDLSKGLPAEIEAVKARYEYYRNKLLTFNPLSA